MELYRKGTHIFVESFRIKTICDQCSSSHVKCDRRLPSCQRCLRMDKPCTRNRTNCDNRVVHCLSRAGWKLQKKTPEATTWAQVISLCPLPPISRLRLQGYLLPLVLLLPKPTDTKEILQLSSYITQAPLHFSEARKSLHVVYNGIEDTLDMATKTFFHLFNPFFPLFSEEGFHSRPRSHTLKKLVVQIGLERMPQTDLVRTAIFTNNLTLQDLTHLPNTLDSLQCLLLAQFGVQVSWIDAARYKTFLVINRLVALLGLHQTPMYSHHWLERTLVLNLTNFGSYSLSVGQSISWYRFVWISESRSHLKPNFLSSAANHFATIDDKIHFITSQTNYHSFTIVLNANRDYTLAIKRKMRATWFATKLTTHLKRLQENFMWGWNALSQLSAPPSSHTAVLRRCRLALKLRYNTDHIEITKLSSYIPHNLLSHLSLTPLAPKISAFSQKGLNVAIQTIELVSTLAPFPFGMDAIKILVPAIAYIIAHAKVFKKTFGHNGHLVKALAQGRQAIACTTNPTHPNPYVNPYLNLIDYFLTRHQIDIAFHLRYLTSPSLPSSD
ncbi:hypothetical protein DSO57_1017835 [Entomophthora muscae]|uniref:Uncharacterized protein n=1 Tax=Entomophthora muscae TaxID=34485 RepID=A0ACC2T4F6_9FUNG|nr:hypothetical protein DSO57_1017835 [Entomophthora muscae]